MQRFHQVLLIVTFLPFCWLGMMAFHELGHVLAGWISGGTVRQVVLYPLTISRTDVEPNLHPVFVVWAGPVAGVLFPITIWLVWHCFRRPFGYLWRFFTGFCLIANGLYIGVGSFEGIGDAGTMLKLGCPIWTLWLFGILSTPLGFWFWHHQGIYFGFGSAKGRVDHRAAYISAALFLIVSTLMFLLSNPS